MQRRLRTLVAAFAIIACALVAGGCSKFNSRRLINEGNKLYKEGKFEEAAATFEDALKEEDIDIAHYNLGITYLKLFIPGSASEQNKKYAARAAEEFAIWLKTHTKDNDARKMMTSVWVDSGDFEKALAYWQKEHDADPKNRDIMGQLASINLKAQRFDETIKWIRMDADAAPNQEGKIKTLVQVGNVVWAKLAARKPTDNPIITVPTVIGAERIHVADVGIGALMEVLAMDANNVESLGLIAAIYNFRATAHGVSWAAAIDRASSQTYGARQRVLLDEAKKKQAQEAPPAAPTTPEKGQGS